jgi:ribonuclease HI
MSPVKKSPLPENTMRKALPLLAILLLAGAITFAASPERYLHVRVTNPTTHENVRVNLPLSLAEKIIPAINDGQLRDGKVQVGGLDANNVNVRAILEALKTAPEGEFVTVQQNDSDVHVAKEHGQLVVHVIDKQSKEKVDVTIPWEVAQALISDTTEDQLNIEAAIRALENIAGDVNLVSVVGHDENVRVWIDSRSTDE